MSVKQIDHLNLSVHDLEASVTWYGRVFGFERVEGGVSNGVPWAIVRSGDALLCLYEHPEREMLDGDALQEKRLHGLNHFALRITDPEAFEESARREGVTVRYGGVVDWPHSKAWYVLDPTGYEIEVALWKDDTVMFGDRSTGC